MTKSRGILRPRHVWTDAQIDILRRDYADTVTRELAARLGAPQHAVHAKAYRLGLSKSEAFQASDRSGRILRGGKLSVATQFKPGTVPPNKGLRRPGWTAGNMAASQFRAGNRPHTWVPVGSYRVNADGYLDRKVTDDGPARGHWVAVHRLVWTAANGPVPAGHAVVFRPGHRTTVAEDITLDALELVSRAELMRRNSLHNLPPDLVEVIRLRGAVNRQINKRAKRDDTQDGR